MPWLLSGKIWLMWTHNHTYVHVTGILNLYILMVSKKYMMVHINPIVYRIQQYNTNFIVTRDYAL